MYLEVFDGVLHLREGARFSFLLFLEHSHSKSFPSESQVVPEL